MPGSALIDFVSSARVACVVAVMFLGGCGFAPLYGSSAAPNEAVIRVDTIPDREGQILRNHLIDRYYRDGVPADPAYILSVAPLTEGVSDLDITVDSEATRQQIRLFTTLTLRDARTGRVILERPINASSSYNILGSQFTTRVSQQTARDGVIADLARQIETHVALALTQKQGP